MDDFTRLDSFVSVMLEFDDTAASFFDKTNVLQNLNIPLERASKDHTTNNTGYWMIDTCKNKNLFIINGRYGKDREIGALTFRDQSLIDYTVCTADRFQILQIFNVMELDPIFFSDCHCALVWSIQCSLKLGNENQNIIKTSSNVQMTLKIISLVSATQNSVLSSWNQTNQPELANSINRITDSIADIFSQAASDSLKQTKRPYKRRHFDKPWFGPACKIARKKYHRARNVYNKTKSFQAKAIVCSTKIS